MFGSVMRMFKSVLCRSRNRYAILGIYVVLSSIVLGYLLWTSWSYASYATDVRFVGTEKHIAKSGSNTTDVHFVGTEKHIAKSGSNTTDVHFVGTEKRIAKSGSNTTDVRFVGTKKHIAKSGSNTTDVRFVGTEKHIAKSGSNTTDVRFVGAEKHIAKSGSNTTDVRFVGTEKHIAKSGSNAKDVRFVGIEKHVDKINLYSSDRHRVDGYNSDDDDVHFRVIVICYNRAESLQRLLKSINNAFYYGDRTIVEVWLDKSSGGVVDNRTLHTALNFSFKHGEYRVFTHSNHVGIYGQWLSTWSPHVNSSEIAVILEDDVAVSPYYYKYLRLVHNKYGRDPLVNGFALQGTHIKYKGPRANLNPPKHQRVYMYPTIGTWGFSPNRKNWFHFLEWFSLAYSDPKFEPFVSGHLSTQWYKHFLLTGRADSMWTMWHIFYSWTNKEFTVFPNFEGHRGLSLHYKEKGLHYDGSLTKRTSSDELLSEWKPEYEQLPDVPPRLDNYGKIMKEYC